MNNTYRLVEMVKQKQGITSDYAVAKLINVSSVKISEWKKERSEANAENTLKLVVAAGISAEDALKLISTRQPAMRQAGYANVYLLGGVSAIGMGAMSLSAVQHTPESLILGGMTACAFALYTLCELI